MKYHFLKIYIYIKFDKNYSIIFKLNYIMITEQIMNSYDKNILLKIELIQLIDKFIELREKQMEMLDEFDDKLQNKIKMIYVKSKL